MSVQLRAGVGEGRPNLKQDVALVQFELNGDPDLSVVMDGQIGPNTQAAIDAFQIKHFGFTDHVIDPGDITFNRLRRPTDPVDDALARLLVLETCHEIGALPAADPLSSRPTADGLGTVTTWSEEPANGIRIYGHPLFGTWEVRGAILDKYVEVGDDAGELGNPISGERDLTTGGRVSWFEHGRIEFTIATGAVVIPLGF